MTSWSSIQAMTRLAGGTLKFQQHLTLLNECLICDLDIWVDNLNSSASLDN